jgi:hypothetical protein
VQGPAERIAWRNHTGLGSQKLLPVPLATTTSIRAAAESAIRRFVEFFTANIRNILGYCTFFLPSMSCGSRTTLLKRSVLTPLVWQYVLQKLLGYDVLWRI